MKYQKCNADITGMDSHICAGRTVASCSTDAIEFLITTAKSFNVPSAHTADKELADLVANQIPGRCYDCVNDKCPCMDVDDRFYCASFKREK